MRKFWLTLALLALPIIAEHACGGDDTMPSGSAGSTSAPASGSVTGSGGATGSATTTGTTTTTGSGGSAGRGG